MPGNHDRFANRRGTPGGNNFERMFSNYWKEKNRVSGKQFKDRNGRDDWAIFFADFSLREALDAPICAAGQGVVYKDVLDELVARTKAVKSNNKFTVVIWVSHFPPVAPCADVPGNLSLEYYKDFMWQANQNGIPSCSLVTYIRAQNSNSMEYLYTALGSACNYSEYLFEGNFLRIFDIDAKDGNVSKYSIENYRYDDQVDLKFNHVSTKSYNL